MMFELLLDGMDRLLNLRDTNAECSVALLPSKVSEAWKGLNFVTPIIESVRTPARITPYPTGRLFWGGPVPGTSCQATIAPSLRDISQQPPVRSENEPRTSSSSSSIPERKRSEDWRQARFAANAHRLIIRNSIIRLIPTNRRSSGEELLLPPNRSGIVIELELGSVFR